MSKHQRVLTTKCIVAGGIIVAVSIPPAYSAPLGVVVNMIWLWFCEEK